MPRRRRHRAALSAALLALALLASCHRALPAAGGTGAAVLPEPLRGALALIPAEAGIVAGLDLERLRATPLGQALIARAADQAAPWLDGLTKDTGSDPVERTSQVLVAVPGERQDDDRFVLVATFPAGVGPRLDAWLRSHAIGATAAFVRAPDRLVVANGAWAAQVRVLAQNPGAASGAADNPELRRLCQRAAEQQGLWVAAIVPADLRRRLMTQGRFSDVASVMRLLASMQVDTGLRMRARAELSNQPDAHSLARRLGAYLHAAKRHPDVLAQGLSPYLEAVRFATRGPNVEALLALPASQASELVDRIVELPRAAWPAAWASPPAKAPGRATGEH